MTETTLKDSFLESFSKRAGKTAIVFHRSARVETELSYGALGEDSDRIGRTFLKEGVRKGDRVLLYLPKCPALVTAYLALHKIGAIAVPLNPEFKKSEMDYLTKDADPKLILCGPAQEPIMEAVARGTSRIVVDTQKPYHETQILRTAPQGPLEPVPVGPDDPALIVYTSGTTGKPKGAVLTQKNLLHDARNIINVWEITEEDVLCHALPLFHVHGLCFALHTALAAGSRVLMLDRFEAGTVVDMLSRKGAHTCTVFMAVPAMYRKLLDSLAGRELDFSHMRLFTSGSAPLLPKDFQEIRDVFGHEPVEREGMSETGMNFSNPLKGKRKPGSIGLPLPGVEVRIVDPETLEDRKQGEQGEIWLKSESITPGYWRKPGETAAVFHDGWFRTGDLGHADAEGYYYLTDRLKHIIISGGENISPKEIENVINALDEVAESSVVGIPDEKWGEKVVAAVVLKPGSVITAAAIQEHCKEHLHKWKSPKDVVFVDRLPRNTMGKVLKEELKGFWRE